MASVLRGRGGPPAGRGGGGGGVEKDAMQAPHFFDPLSKHAMFERVLPATHIACARAGQRVHQLQKSITSTMLGLDLAMRTASACITAPLEQATSLCQDFAMAGATVACPAEPHWLPSASNPQRSCPWGATNGKPICMQTSRP